MEELRVEADGGQAGLELAGDLLLDGREHVLARRAAPDERLALEVEVAALEREDHAGRERVLEPGARVRAEAALPLVPGPRLRAQRHPQDVDVQAAHAQRREADADPLARHEADGREVADTGGGGRANPSRCAELQVERHRTESLEVHRARPEVDLRREGRQRGGQVDAQAVPRVDGVHRHVGGVEARLEPHDRRRVVREGPGERQRPARVEAEGPVLQDCGAGQEPRDRTRVVLEGLVVEGNDLPPGEADLPVARRGDGRRQDGEQDGGRQAHANVSPARPPGRAAHRRGAVPTGGANGARGSPGAPGRQAAGMSRRRWWPGSFGHSVQVTTRWCWSSSSQ